MINKSQLEKICCPILYNEPLSSYTYTRVGGPADILAFPRTAEELSKLVKLATESATELTVLGNASNLIVRDGGISGLVILLDKMDAIHIHGNEIEAEAGAKLKDVTKFAQENSLAHFEFACGIPGSIGGAVYMNAGAYGGEIKQVLKSVKVLNPATTEILTVGNADLDFAYRQSRIEQEGWIVLSAKFLLQVGDKGLIKARMDELDKSRAEKQPLEYPSCGSVFKRPEGYFAGRLIKEAGCSGYRIGGIEVSKKHAGFMVNVNHGTAADYENLIMYVIEKVKENSGVTLEPEVRIIGVSLNK